eukprot:4763207-Alexandrium_andersonii.AAC.1
MALLLSVRRLAKPRCCCTDPDGTSATGPVGRHGSRRARAHAAGGPLLAANGPRLQVRALFVRSGQLTFGREPRVWSILAAASVA